MQRRRCAPRRKVCPEGLRGEARIASEVTIVSPPPTCWHRIWEVAAEQAAASARRCSTAERPDDRLCQPRAKRAPLLLRAIERELAHENAPLQSARELQHSVLAELCHEIGKRGEERGVGHLLGRHARVRSFVPRVKD